MNFADGVFMKISKYYIKKEDKSFCFGMRSTNNKWVNVYPNCDPKGWIKYASNLRPGLLRHC